MKQFTGFPAKTQFTALPNVFFSTLLPQISDIAELKVTLHLLGTLYRKQGFPRFITYRELQADKSLAASFNSLATSPEPLLRAALELATKRGTILHLKLDRDGVPEDLYFLNTERDRQIVARIQNGELEIPGLHYGGESQLETEEPPDVFTLYEQNIGMLTPMIAEELGEAEKLYPENWIKEAIKEAVTHNKRNWRYVAAILERWSTEGKSNGTHQRYSAKKTDPDKYIKGKYGHMVQR